MRRSIRRSEIEAISAAAIASASSAIAGVSPWKFPPDSSSPSSGKTIGLSVTESISVASTPSVKRITSRAAPCTCGMQRRE
jgi:hypothetical protein